ncbi:hypothetical protein Sjap_017796 [Stephania japonica]|uniref:Uncharacterized protein n=1 Tax=Stephania japonica TaxID=461633 RepID=A0AAP0NMF7_9MAGN
MYDFNVLACRNETYIPYMTCTTCGLVFSVLVSLYEQSLKLIRLYVGTLTCSCRNFNFLFELVILTKFDILKHLTNLLI